MRSTIVIKNWGVLLWGRTFTYHLKWWTQKQVCLPYKNILSYSYA